MQFVDFPEGWDFSLPLKYLSAGFADMLQQPDLTALFFDYRFMILFFNGYFFMLRAIFFQQGFK